MRAKRVYEFLKTGDAKSSLGIGRVAEIRELFGSVGISDDQYKITDTEVVFKGDLDLSKTPITSLPDGLSVRGNLILWKTPIAALPDGLNVEGSLDLEETSITSLPDGLSVGGHLDLRGTPITSLPDRLSVGTWLDLRRTHITSLPNRLSVRGGINADLSQKDLISFIKSSRFANKLQIF